MTNRWRVAAVIVLLLFLTGYLSYTILNYRGIGVDVVLNDSGQYEVVEVDSKYWGNGRLFPGDILISVNGKEPSLHDSIKRYSFIEMAHRLEIYRTGANGITNKLEIDVDNGLPLKELTLHFLLPLASLLLLFGFSALVYKRKREDQAAIYLILFFLSIGFAYFSAPSSARSSPVGQTCLVIAFVMVPTCFIHFINEYLKRFSERFMAWRSLMVCYLLSGVIIAFNISELFIEYFPETRYGSLLMLIYFAVLNVIIVYKLIAKFIYHRQDQFRSLFKFTLLGHLIGFAPFILLFAVPRIFGVVLVPAEVTALFLFAIPVVYLYMFTTRRLFDVDFLMSRFLYYTIISVFPASLTTGIAVLIMSQNEFSWIKWVQLFLAVYLMITIFLFIKEYADLRLRPKLNKDLYNYQGSLDRFSKRISRVMKPSDLEKVLEQEILSILPVKEVAFIELYQERSAGMRFRVSSGVIQEEIAAVISGCTRKLAIGEVIAVPEGLCMVMGQRKSTCNLMWLSDKVNQTQFNRDEFNWLKTLSGYSAIVYENLYLIENLLEDLESEIQKQKGASPWVLRLIFNLSENERRRLAADLHDSALQDQLIWYRRLEAFMQDFTMLPEHRDELEAIREGLLDVIHQIRETCNELRPPLLKEMGITEALEHLFEEAQMRSNYSIDFRVKPLVRELTDEQTLAIYRMVQELLRNAGKHAKADNILIELEQRDCIWLHYKDDGVGMVLHELSDSFQHMGLSGIKERVRSLEGQITFVSEMGEGFEVFIKLPFETAEHHEMEKKGGGVDGTHLAG